MDYEEGMEVKSMSGVPTIESFPEIKLDELISKYGPEGLYDIADLLRITADEDVSDAMAHYHTIKSDKNHGYIGPVGMKDDETDETGAP